MANYYELMKAGADERCREYFATVRTLAAQLPKVKKRLEDERRNRDNLQNRLEKLKELSVESLAGDANSYEKYKVSMKKLQNELQVSEEIIENVTRKVLPGAEQRLKDAERNLSIVLRQIIIETRKDADAEINELLRNCVRQYDLFLEASARIFQDYGLTFICSDESYCPGPWPAMEVRDMRLRLGLVESAELSYERVWRDYGEKTGKSAPGTSQGDDSTPEPAGLPPEGVSSPEPAPEALIGTDGETYEPGQETEAATPSTMDDRLAEGTLIPPETVTDIENDL